MQFKFQLGRTCITSNALNALYPADVPNAVVRHACGDWGEMCEEDKAINEQSLQHGLRLMSAFTDRRGVKFWIITEADRSATTVLLPEDY